MGGNGTDIFRQVTKGIALEAARMRGKHRRGENGGFDSRGGEDRQCYGQRAFSDAGNIVNGQNSFLHDGPLF